MKSSLSPILAVCVWFFATYLFVILWGIAEIIFEFSLPVLKLILCFLGTLYFAVFLITKLLCEFHTELTGSDFIIKSVLSKREKIVFSSSADNLIKVSEKSEKKAKNFTKPFQKGKCVYLTFKDSDGEITIKIKCTKKLVQLLEKGMSKK